MRCDTKISANHDQNWDQLLILSSTLIKSNSVKTSSTLHPRCLPCPSHGNTSKVKFSVENSGAPSKVDVMVRSETKSQQICGQCAMICIKRYNPDNNHHPLSASAMGLRCPCRVQRVVSIKNSPARQMLQTDPLGPRVGIHQSRNRLTNSLACCPP